MGSDNFDNELHGKTGVFEKIRDWMVTASANDYRVIVHRTGTDLYASCTQSQYHNLEAEAADSRSAYDTAAATDLSVWPSMTAAEKTDSYNCFKSPGLRFFRVHRGSPFALLPSDIADSTVTALEISDFEDAADISESEFLDEVDASSIGDWFDDLASAQRSGFASNFANR